MFGRRLDRWLLLGVLVTGLVGFAVINLQNKGVERLSFNYSDAAAWLPSVATGEVHLVDGTIVDGSLRIAASVKVAAPGRDFEVVQMGVDAVVVDSTRGEVRRVAAATESMLPAENWQRVYDDAGNDLRVEVFGTLESAWAYSPKTAVLREFDARQVTVSSDEIPIRGEPQGGVVTGRSVVVLDRSSGDLVSYDPASLTRAPSRFKVAAAGVRAHLGTASGNLVVVTTGAGGGGSADYPPPSIEVTDPTGRSSERSCSMEINAETSEQRYEISTAGSQSPDVVVVNPASGRAILADVSANDCGQTLHRAGEPDDDFGQPVFAGRRAFVPNFTRDEVVIIEASAEPVRIPIPVERSGQTFDLISEGGVVFFNDARGSLAGVIGGDGRVVVLQKFTTEAGNGEAQVAGGPSPEPVDTPIPDPPLETPVAPTATPTPTPAAAEDRSTAGTGPGEPSPTVAPPAPATPTATPAPTVAIEPTNDTPREATAAPTLPPTAIPSPAPTVTPVPAQAAVPPPNPTVTPVPPTATSTPLPAQPQAQPVATFTPIPMPPPTTTPVPPTLIPVPNAQPQPPTATATPANVPAPTPVVVCVPEAAGAKVGESLRFQWSEAQGSVAVTATAVTWDFGDGTQLTLDGATRTTQHVYDAEGTFNVAVVVTTTAGVQLVAACSPVTISPDLPPLNAVINVSAESVADGGQLTFSADPDADGYEWSFPSSSPASSIDRAVTVTFTNPSATDRQVSVTLVVRRGAEADSATRTITVRRAQAVTATVPNVIGMTEADARIALSGAGFQSIQTVSGCFIDETSRDAGKAGGTNPTGGQSQATDQVVQLFVSNGTAIFIPQFTNLANATAFALGTVTITEVTALSPGEVQQSIQGWACPPVEVSVEVGAAAPTTAPDPPTVTPVPPTPTPHPVTFNPNNSPYMSNITKQFFCDHVSLEGVSRDRPELLLFEASGFASGQSVPVSWSPAAAGDDGSDPSVVADTNGIVRIYWECTPDQARVITMMIGSLAPETFEAALPPFCGGEDDRAVSAGRFKNLVVMRSEAGPVLDLNGQVATLASVDFFACQGFIGPSGDGRYFVDAVSSSNTSQVLGSFECNIAAPCNASFTLTSPSSVLIQARKSVTDGAKISLPYLQLVGKDAAGADVAWATYG